MSADTVYDGWLCQSVSKPSSWSDIRRAVRRSYRLVSQVINQTPHNFWFRQVGSLRRLYFLSIPTGSRENTLLYVDLPTENAISSQPLEWHEALEPFDQSNSAQLSKEEQLLRERKRQYYIGIASYDYQDHGQVAHFAFAAGESLFVCSDDLDGNYQMGKRMPVTRVASSCSGKKSQIDPKICPTNPNLLAFVSGKDLWVTCTTSGCEKRLTYAHRGLNNLASDPKSAGVPSFVIQEEFDRYTGYWWQTTTLPASADAGGKRTYRILYEEVDESQVDILKIISPSSEGASVDEYRYPKAGSVNATSTLRLVEFSIDDKGSISNVVDRSLYRPLFSIFPNMEYLLKVGWMPDGERIYFELINRLQNVTQLVVMGLDCFVPSTDLDGDIILDSMDASSSNNYDSDDELLDDTISPKFWILYEETSDKWINVNDLLYILPQTCPDKLQFIRGSEGSGYMHLYLITVSLTQPIGHHGNDIDHTVKTSPGFKASVVEEVQLTNGEWAVDFREIWVDEIKEFVYFIGYKDTPLEMHLYVVSLCNPGHVTRLTKEGFSHSITMDKACSMFVTVYSSVSTTNACEVYSFESIEGRMDPPGCLGSVLKAQESTELQPPELFSFPSTSGYDLHGMFYKPKNLDTGRKYPVLLFVYCGPQVQLVSNSYKAVRFVRLHTLSEMGFAVVVIDGRGSCHRGLDFESHIRLRLGSVEVEDQVEGLEWLAKRNSFMDMSRVAIHGWSYGGYISLMALVQRPEIFKVAVAGAPVTSWNLYDTGYTERYMDLPKNNPTGYANGSLLKLVERFPNEEGRLLIVQGLMDENVHFYHTSSLIDALVKACKPHTLQVYPNERHGIRSSEANEHYETMLISFLQRNL